MQKLKPPVFLNKYNTKGNKRKLLALGAILIVALAGFAVWSLFNDKLSDKGNLYAQAAGHKIYEKDLRNLLGDNNLGVSDSEAATVLADKYLLESLAKEQGIAVSDEELTTEYGKDVLKQKDENKFAYQNKLNELYFTKLAADNRGVYKGKMLVTHFSRFVPFEPMDKPRGSLIGNPKAIARDKKYAKDLIDRLHSDIRSGKITFDEAMKIERNDHVVGLKGYPTLSHSGTFDNSSTTDGLIKLPSVQEEIRNISPGEMSEPFVVRVGNSLENDSTAESYFLLIQLGEAFGGNKANIDFGQYLDEAKKRLEYEVYV